MYLLHNVYSSLLVTPRGGGRNCQPSWTSVQKIWQRKKEKNKGKIACQCKHKLTEELEYQRWKWILDVLWNWRGTHPPHSLQATPAPFYSSQPAIETKLVIHGQKHTLSSNMSLSYAQKLWWEVLIKGDPCAFHREMKTQVTLTARNSFRMGNIRQS